jgi:hypothetical protein
MQAPCKDCGEPTIAGQVVSQERSRPDTPVLFVVNAGTPTSWNPVRALLQGMRQDPDYREEAYPIRGRVCPRCGKVEVFLEAADLTKLGEFAAAPGRPRD